MVLTLVQADAAYRASQGHCNDVAANAVLKMLREEMQNVSGTWLDVNAWLEVHTEMNINWQAYLACRDDTPKALIFKHAAKDVLVMVFDEIDRNARYLPPGKKNRVDFVIATDSMCCICCICCIYCIYCIYCICCIC